MNLQNAGYIHVAMCANQVGAPVFGCHWFWQGWANLWDCYRESVRLTAGSCFRCPLVLLLFLGSMMVVEKA
jgi:hypothetical protein